MKLKSVWGTWWEPIRKWFYPLWLGYEISYRFYDYSLGAYHYVVQQSSQLSIGSMTTNLLALLCSVITFLICSVYLTAPACYILFHFFNTDNLTDTVIEKRMKIVF